MSHDPQHPSPPVPPARQGDDTPGTPPVAAGGWHGRRRTDLAVALVLAVATFLLYLPSLSNGFVEYDDPMYVTANPVVQQGLTWATVKWAFTTSTFGNWLPVTWLSHLLDVELFGLNPAGHHATSSAIHAVNAGLVFLALAALTGARWRPAIVALLFAVHPLRVESVCWIAERKDVLCGTFFLLVLLAYAGYCRRPSAGRYALVLVMLALGLMSKTMLVTVPFLLLLLDFWPLRRLGLGREAAPAGARGDGAAGANDAPAADAARPGLGRIVLEKVPMLGLAAVSCVWTVVFQSQVGAMWGARDLTLWQRVANAVVSIPRYLWLTAWPAEQSIFYPHPGQWPAWRVGVSAALVVALSTAALLLLRRHRYLAVGWLWFLGMLVPVVGLVQVGLASMADRYTYLPGIGLAVAAVWGAAELLAARPRWRRPLAPLAAAAVLVLAVATVRQQRHWATTRTLFERALAVDERNWLAHDMVGTACDAAGEFEAALAHFRRAIELNPGHPDPHHDRAQTLHRLGRVDEAIESYRTALRLQPARPITHFNLGVALASRQRFAEAVAEFEAASSFDPGNAQVRVAWGVALLSQGKKDEAAVRLWEALRLDPHNRHARQWLARARPGPGVAPDGAPSAAAPSGEIGQ